MSKQRSCPISEHVEPTEPWPRPRPKIDPDALILEAMDLVGTFRDTALSVEANNVCAEWVKKAGQYVVSRMSESEKAFHRCRGKVVASVDMDDSGKKKEWIRVHFDDGSVLVFLDAGPDHAVALEAKLIEGEEDGE